MYTDPNTPVVANLLPASYSTCLLPSLIVIFLSFHVWLTNCPKLKIDLHRRYVAQNLQKCVQILIQFSESKSNQNWGCCGPKTIGQKKSEKMVRKRSEKVRKKWSEFWHFSEWQLWLLWLFRRFRSAKVAVLVPRPWDLKYNTCSLMGRIFFCGFSKLFPCL